MKSRPSSRPSAGRPHPPSPARRGRQIPRAARHQRRSIVTASGSPEGEATPTWRGVQRVGPIPPARLQAPGRKRSFSPMRMQGANKSRKLPRITGLRNAASSSGSIVDGIGPILLSALRPISLAGTARPETFARDRPFSYWTSAAAVGRTPARNAERRDGRDRRPQPATAPICLHRFGASGLDHPRFCAYFAMTRPADLRVLTNRRNEL